MFELRMYRTAFELIRKEAAVEIDRLMMLYSDCGK